MAEAQSSPDNLVTSRASKECDALKVDSFTVDEPFLITGNIVPTTLKSTKLMASLQFNQTRFMKDPKIDMAKGGTGRGQVAPKSDVMQAEMFADFKTFFGPFEENFIFGDDLEELFAKSTDWPDEEKDSLKGALAGCYFGMQANHQFSGNEKNLLPCLRVGVAGVSWAGRGCAVQRPVRGFVRSRRRQGRRWLLRDGAGQVLLRGSHRPAGGHLRAEAQGLARHRGSQRDPVLACRCPVLFFALRFLLVGVGPPPRLNICWKSSCSSVAV